MKAKSRLKYMTVFCTECNVRDVKNDCRICDGKYFYKVRRRHYNCNLCFEWFVYQPMYNWQYLYCCRCIIYYSQYVAKDILNKSPDMRYIIKKIEKNNNMTQNSNGSERKGS